MGSVVEVVDVAVLVCLFLPSCSIGVAVEGDVCV